ncbi:MAG TPA: response regulator, partial [Chitinophaga sp.]|uniref:sensor histidine kinase n=1 Tax=Chitinophaga sp. TaxID=1869181 RepID=UPI002DBBFA07
MKKFTILLVDDRPENLHSLKAMLDAEHRHFILAGSGSDALREVLRHDDIGLILLDVQMPDIDGLEVARLLKADPGTRKIAIIFVTASNKEEQDMIMGFEQGAVDYLLKPLNVNICRAKVDVFERLYFYEQELKQALAEKEQVNSQLERFMHTVAHDLKSPLSGVAGLLLLLKEEMQLENTPDLVNYLEMAISSTMQLSEMISAILEYSSHHPLDQAAEEVDVHELLEQLTGLLFLPGHVTIRIQPDLPVLHTNRQKLWQVFQNLLSNAIKYNDKQETEIDVGGTLKGAFYEFYVKDNGPGIEEKDNTRIFRLFEKLDKDNEKGTGIGLNILKLLVEGQGGRVWVTSVPGEGSCFYF